MEVKTDKIKDSKRVLESYIDRLREVVLDNERLKVLLHTNGFESEVKQNVSGSPSKEKLIYELGGRDGANTALKFID